MSAIVSVRASGSRGPVIIFVHGVGSTAAIWDAQLRFFAQKYRCYAVELRGNGATKPDPPAETVTRGGFVDDVLAAADLTLDDQFHYVGCSLGGVVGFELWKRAPQRVRSLTLVGSFAAYPSGQKYASGVIATVRAAGSMEAFSEQRARALGMNPGKRALETMSQMACKSVACYEASTRATWTGDYRGMLPDISAPTLVMCGEHDAVAPSALSAEIASAIRGARLEVLPAAGHVANADAPDRFNEVLDTFLSAV